VITDDLVARKRLACPPGPDEWLSNDVWSLISRCWSTSWDNRPDHNAVIIGLKDAGDVAELRSRGFSEVDLVSLLNDCKDGPRCDQDVKKAQEIVDMLDLVRQLRNRLS